MTWRSPKNLHRSPPSFQLNTNLSTYRVKPHKTGEVQIPRNSNYCRETCRQENGLWIDWATELSKARVGSDWGSESRSVVSDSATPWTIHSPWNSPGQNIGVRSLSLLQGIFPTQGSNPGSPHCRWILIWDTREAKIPWSLVYRSLEIEFHLSCSNTEGWDCD